MNDYLRHHYVRREADRYMMDYLPKSDTSTESTVVARDLAAVEARCIEALSNKRREVFVLRRFEGLSAAGMAGPSALTSPRARWKTTSSPLPALCAAICVRASE